MNPTNIEYLTHSWNPLAMRCTQISEGCANCWHLTMANRLAANPVIDDRARAAYAGESGPALIEGRLDEPLKRRKPAVIGVQFMGDLFHTDVPAKDVWRVIEIARKATQHEFIFLTKRAGRMFDVLSITNDMPENIWLGVSIEGQKTANLRIPPLLELRAQAFVSYEPALRRVDLRAWLGPVHQWKRLDWVIAGAESGPQRRTTDSDDIRAVRDQCRNHGIPFYLKQLYINNKRTSMPELDGRVWDQVPTRIGEILRSYQ